jgi:hypothetical protein
MFTWTVEQFFFNLPLFHSHSDMPVKSNDVQLMKLIDRKVWVMWPKYEAKHVGKQEKLSTQYIVAYLSTEDTVRIGSWVY